MCTNQKLNLFLKLLNVINLLSKWQTSYINLKKLMLSGKLQETFRKFEQQFEIYITAAGIMVKTAVIQRATLLHVIGPDAVEIFNSFKWNEDRDTAGDGKKVEKILGKYEMYCSPQCNVTYERHQFNIRNQNEGESIDAYVTSFRVLSKTCEFGDLADSLLRDRLVCGVKKKTVRSRSLREADLTLQKAIEICRSAETSSQQLKAMQSLSAEGNGDIVRKKEFKNKPNKSAETKAETIQICDNVDINMKHVSALLLVKFAKTATTKKTFCQEMR